MAEERLSALKPEINSMLQPTSIFIFCILHNNSASVLHLMTTLHPTAPYDSHMPALHLSTSLASWLLLHPGRQLYILMNAELAGCNSCSADGIISMHRKPQTPIRSRVMAICGQGQPQGVDQQSPGQLVCLETMQCLRKRWVSEGYLP